MKWVSMRIRFIGEMFYFSQGDKFNTSHSKAHTHTNHCSIPFFLNSPFTFPTAWHRTRYTTSRGIRLQFWEIRFSITWLIDHCDAMITTLSIRTKRWPSCAAGKYVTSGSRGAVTMVRSCHRVFLFSSSATRVVNRGEIILLVEKNGLALMGSDHRQQLGGIAAGGLRELFHGLSLSPGNQCLDNKRTGHYVRQRQNPYHLYEQTGVANADWKHTEK